MKLQESKLTEVCKKEGIRKTQLAKEAEVSTRSVNRAEKTEKVPEEVTLYKILRGLNKLATRQYEFDEVFIK
ncbi:helix-turn-helix domain-containing protein [Marinoscillum sp. 108]|uniref:helix-turn-helix domain-containing protein n=1 Tax=Marinoscillum sp. 108 TaxID=2653151 RepID=UPI0012EF55D2|nr:helix-turn-helix domain-containing protein [Marinoscillum sp. 108]VXD19565.1 hypothetical protein MARINOS108_20774 [Marinoscillum sp. 108]